MKNNAVITNGRIDLVSMVFMTLSCWKLVDEWLLHVHSTRLGGCQAALSRDLLYPVITAVVMADLIHYHTLFPVIFSFSEHIVNRWCENCTSQVLFISAHRQYVEVKLQYFMKSLGTVIFSRGQSPSEIPMTSYWVTQFQFYPTFICY